MPILTLIAMTTHTHNPSFFFSVKHIIKPHAAKLIYGIHYNDTDHFILKTPGANECEQLDSNARIDPEILKKICKVISEVEKGYKNTPPLELINIDVYNMLAKNEGKS